MRRGALMLAALAAACFVRQAFGAPQESAPVAAAIRHAALAIAPPGATVSLGPVAGAKYMQACAAPLSVTISGVAPYEQAAAHCASPAWTLYVTITVAQTQNIVVAARPISAGQSIAAGDVILAREPVSLYAGRQVFYDPAQLLGANATMSLPQGMIFSPENIAEPVLVKAGQTVSVQVISGGVQLSVNAVADEAGRIGDTILLTNPSSGKRFTAMVTSSGPVLRLSS